MLAILPTAARNIIASPTGISTAKGTLHSPLDLPSALQLLQPGDSLFLRGGTYQLPEGLTMKVAGTSAERHTFVGAFGEERPVLDFHTQPHYKNGLTLSADYVHLRGLSICYAGYKGLLCTGSYCVLDGLDVYGCCDSGIQMKGGHSNLITDCDSHDNFDYTTGSLEAADWGGNADGFADKQYTGSPGNTYVRCRAWGNSDDGWDFFQRVGGTTKLIECECRDNGPREYDLTQHPRRQTDRDFLDQFDGEGLTITLKKGKKATDAPPRQVSCSLAHFYNNGNGNGFKLGGGSTRHDVELTDCLATTNRVKGFDQNSNAGHITLLRCTSTANGQNYGFYNDNGYTLHVEQCKSHGSLAPDTFRGSHITLKDNDFSQ